MKALGVAIVFVAGLVVGWMVAPVKNRSSEDMTRMVADMERLKQQVARCEGARELRADAVLPMPVPSAIATPSATPTDSPAPADSVPIAEAPAVKKNWRTAEKAAGRVDSFDEVPGFLEKVKVPDFLSELAQAKPIDQDDALVDVLNGTYVGSMFSRDGKELRVSLDAFLRKASDGVRGRVAIRIIRDGKIVSRSSNSGDIRSIQRLGGESVAVVVSSGDYHFQLYYLSHLESFEGNCYQQVNPGSIVYAGAVHLERQNR